MKSSADLIVAVAAVGATELVLLTIYLLLIRRRDTGAEARTRVPSKKK